MLLSELSHWQAVALQGFSYLADPVGKDTWRSHAIEALAGTPWHDDCDGLAETVLDLCFQHGCALSDGYRLVVAASSDGSGHMVACINTSDVGLMICGDTFNPLPYYAEMIRHKPNVYNRLSEQSWRKGFPWTLK